MASLSPTTWNCALLRYAGSINKLYLVQWVIKTYWRPLGFKALNWDFIHTPALPQTSCDSGYGFSPFHLSVFSVLSIYLISSLGKGCILYVGKGTRKAFHLHKRTK